MHPQVAIKNFIERNYIHIFSEVLIKIDNHIENKSIFTTGHLTSTVIDLTELLGNKISSILKVNVLIATYIENYYKNLGWSKAEIKFHNEVKIYKKQTLLNKWFFGLHSDYEISDGLFLHLSY